MVSTRAKPDAAPATPREKSAATPVKKARRRASANMAAKTAASEKQGRSIRVPLPTFGSLAAAHLIGTDARFEALVAEHGTLNLGSIKSQPTPFAALVKTIVYQQLAGKVAATIHSRLKEAIKADPPTPAAVLATAHADLRAAGLASARPCTSSTSPRTSATAV